MLSFIFGACLGWLARSALVYYETKRRIRVMNELIQAMQDEKRKRAVRRLYESQGDN